MKVKRIIVKCLALSFTAYVLCGCASYVRQNIYFPDQRTPQKIQIADTQFIPINAGAETNSPVIGLKTHPQTNSKAVILFLHGNGGSAMTAAEQIAPLHAAGYDLIIADYRGYGGNPGIPTEAGLITDAVHFANYANKYDKPLILVGHSMGGAIATLIAEQTNAQALITVGAFTSLPNMTNRFGRLFLRDHYNALFAAKNVLMPWIIIHAPNDETVPYSHGEALYQAARRNMNVKLAQDIDGDHSINVSLLIEKIDELFNLIE